MAKQTGLDALLQALKNSGMDVNQGDFGEQAQEPFEQSPYNVEVDASEAPGAQADAGQGQGQGQGQGGQGQGRQGQAPGFSAFFGGQGGKGKRGRRGGNGGSGGDGPRPHVELPFQERISNWGRKAFTIAAIVLVIVLLCAYWWFHPAINIHSSDCWFFVAIFVLLPFFLVFKTKQHNYTSGTAKVEKNASKAKTFKLLSYIPLVIVLIGLVGALLSFSFIPGNAKRYANILPIEDKDFAADIQPVNYSEVPIIDHDAASILGNREMGTIADYVSQFEVNDLYSQINFRGTPVRVSPLDYADLIKWLFNRSEGLPAYVVVNMTTQEADVVRLSDIDGAGGSGIKYSESEPLARNIQRYVQLRHPFYMFDEFSFEIDEDGHPWWICPVQTRTIGLFGGTTIKRVVLCDAVTGECQDMKIEDVPQWVDRAYPSDLLIQQFNWYGMYQNGWINSWLGQSGVVRTTPGSDGLAGYNYIAKDDDVWVYTGVTSATGDNSIVGFILINQRTAAAHFYSVVGATELSAMDSAEGLVQQFKYGATFPILLNVVDRPTYFLALKDSSGYVKQFAFMDVNQINLGATGATVAEAQKAYVNVLAGNSVDVSGGGGTGGSEVTGTIASMAQAVLDGNSHYYVRLSGDDRLYDFALPAQIGILRYGVGSTITLTYLEGSPTCMAELVK